MVFTLLNAATEHISNGNHRKAGIVKAYAETTPLLAAMPFLNLPQGAGLGYGWTEEGVMATAAFRGLNASYTAGEDKSTPRNVQLKIAGGTCQIDRALVKSMGQSQRDARVLAKVKAISQMTGYKLIHGDTSTTAAEVDGLTNRFPIAGSRAVANGGSALSMLKLDEAIDETEGRGTHILLNRATARHILAYLRTLGSIEMTIDAFGRPIPAYDGKPFIIADPVNVNSSYRALPFTEAGSTASLFVLNLGLDQFHGVQSGGMEIVDLADTGVLLGNLVEWIVALADEGPRCVTRLTGFTSAVAVA